MSQLNAISLESADFKRWHLWCHSNELIYAKNANFVQQWLDISVAVGKRKEIFLLQNDLCVPIIQQGKILFIIYLALVRLLNC